MSSVVALFLLGQADPGLALQFTETDATAVIRSFEILTGAKVELAPLYAGRKISIDTGKRPVAECLHAVAKALGGEAKSTGIDRYRIAPSWQHAIFEKLETSKARELEMKDVELGQALRLFHTQCGVRVHATVDPSRKIALSADDVDYRVVLDRIAKAAGCAWDLRYGVVYLAPAAELRKLPVRPPALAKDRSFPLHLENKSMEDALRFLQAASNRTFEWPEKLPARTISIRARSVTLSQALALVLYPAGLTAREAGGKIVVERLDAAATK